MMAEEIAVEKPAKYWTDEQVTEYFKTHYGDRGIALYVADYQYAALPAHGDKWVYVDIDNNVASEHRGLTELLQMHVQKHWGPEYSVRILRCGPESMCYGGRDDGCDVEVVNRRTGEKDVWGVCTYI